MEHPEYEFEGHSDIFGMIDKWINTCSHEIKTLPCTPSMEGVHWEMRFHLRSSFSETGFSDICNTLWIPKDEDSHIVLNIHEDKYTVSRSKIPHGGTLKSHTVSVDGSQKFETALNPSGSDNFNIRVVTSLPYGNTDGPRDLMTVYTPSGSDDAGIRDVSPLPFDRISGFNEPACVSAGPDDPGAAFSGEDKLKKRKRG